jgi:hypothetical protein
MLSGLVGSEMFLRDSNRRLPPGAIARIVFFGETWGKRGEKVRKP